MAQYTRGQIDSALVIHFCSGRNKISSAVLKTRTKRLLETDALEAKSTGLSCAFVTDYPGDRGNERVFSAYDCFTLGLAHELLGMGFKQGEIVFLLQHAKAGLRQNYKRIENYPNAFRQDVSLREYPDIPPRADSPSLCDLRVFFIFENIDQLSSARKSSFVAPRLCFGMTSLTFEIEKRSYDSMKLTVIEIANLVISLREKLNNAPRVQRGRPRKVS